MGPAQHGPWISTHVVPMTPCTPSQTQTWFSWFFAAAQFQTSQGPQKLNKSLRAVWPHWQQGTETPLRCLSRCQATTEPLVAKEATDINPDPGFCWALDQPGPRLHYDSLWTVQATQTAMTLMVTRPSDTSMATGCRPDPRHACGFWSYHGPWTSI